MLAQACTLTFAHTKACAGSKALTRDRSKLTPRFPALACHLPEVPMERVAVCYNIFAQSAHAIYIPSFNI